MCLLKIFHCPENKLYSSNFWRMNVFEKKKNTTKLWLQNLIFRNNYSTKWASRSWKNNLYCFYFLLCHLSCFMYAWKVVLLWWNNPIHEWTFKAFWGNKLLLMARLVSLGGDTPPSFVFCEALIFEFFICLRGSALFHRLMSAMLAFSVFLCSRSFAVDVSFRK